MWWRCQSPNTNSWNSKPSRANYNSISDQPSSNHTKFLTMDTTTMTLAQAARAEKKDAETRRQTTLTKERHRCLLSWQKSQSELWEIWRKMYVTATMEAQQREGKHQWDMVSSRIFTHADRVCDMFSLCTEFLSLVLYSCINVQERQKIEFLVKIGAQMMTSTRKNPVMTSQ